LKLLRPSNGTLSALAEIPPHTTKVVAIVQQIDAYKPASLKTKYSWTSRIPN